MYPDNGEAWVLTYGVWKKTGQDLSVRGAFNLVHDHLGRTENSHGGGTAACLKGHTFFIGYYENVGQAGQRRNKRGDTVGGRGGHGDDVQGESGRQGATSTT